MRHWHRIREWLFATVAVVSVLIGFASSHLSSISSKVWLTRNYAIDIDHYLIRRVRITESQNLVFIPYDAITSICVFIPIAYLLRNSFPLFVNEVRGAKRDRERFRLRDLHARKICASCGYDLRASPQRCPECGAEPTSPESAV